MREYLSHVDVIDYANARRGNRPPNIKTSDGTYFTISDAALEIAQGYVGQEVDITYFENDRGYCVATALNGEELPRDQQRGSPQARPAQARSPQARSAQARPAQARQQSAPATGDLVSAASVLGKLIAKAVLKHGQMQSYTALAVACVESGKAPADFQDWRRIVGNAMRGGEDAMEREAQRRREEEERLEQQRQQEEQQRQKPQAPADDFDDDIPF